MLRGLDFLPVDVPLKLLVDLDDLLEIQFLKVYVHPPDKEVNEITLL